jgi:hypothetical protein
MPQASLDAVGRDRVIGRRADAVGSSARSGAGLGGQGRAWLRIFAVLARRPAVGRMGRSAFVPSLIHLPAACFDDGAIPRFATRANRARTAASSSQQPACGRLIAAALSRSPGIDKSDHF